MREVVIDPKIRFGKPILRGTRITVEEVLGALVSGMDFEEIEREYALKKNQILVAIKYANGWIRGEVTKEYAISTGR